MSLRIKHESAAAQWLASQDSAILTYDHLFAKRVRLVACMIVSRNGSSRTVTKHSRIVAKQCSAINPNNPNKYDMDTILYTDTMQRFMKPCALRFPVSRVGSYLQDNAAYHKSPQPHREPVGRPANAASNPATLTPFRN